MRRRTGNQRKERQGAEKPLKEQLFAISAMVSPRLRTPQTALTAEALLQLTPVSVAWSIHTPKITHSSSSPFLPSSSSAAALTHVKMKQIFSEKTPINLPPKKRIKQLNIEGNYHPAKSSQL
jgi:hypothetical protein